MTRSKRTYLYLSLIAVHILIAMVAFIRFRLNHCHILFCNDGDGLKNAFTLISYVKDTAGGVFKYNTFDYPFGDYIYYTDNTPLFAIPFKLFCQHVYDLSKYTMSVFNIFVISAIIFSGILVYYILRRLLRENVISYMMAIILPWTNVQVWRIWHGNYNLSFSFFSLLAIALVMWWHQHRDNARKQLWAVAGMVLLTLVSFLAHGYYLAIITMFISFMLFFYGILNRKEPYGKRALITALIYPIIAAGLVVALIYTTDGYLSMRRETAHGYDGGGTKIRLSGMIDHYYFQKYFFFIDYELENAGNIEMASYLGNVGLYAVFIMCLVAVISKPFRKQLLQIQKDYFKDPLKAGILLGSVVLLSVSLGELYYTHDGIDNHGYVFTNITNPFFYLHYVTNRVEQFRYICRFFWPFYFGFYVWVLCTLAEVYRQVGRRAQVMILIGIALAGGYEVKDYVDEMQKSANKENLLDVEHIATATPARLDTSPYQAIIPIPYYHVGSEDYDITIDDQNNWSAYTFQLALKTHLPLMSCKLSRVPPLFNRLLLDYVAYDSVDQRLTSKLSNKPILIAYNRKLVNEGIPGSLGRGSQREQFYINSLQLPERHHLQPVDSLDDIIFYSYYPKR